MNEKPLAVADEIPPMILQNHLAVPADNQSVTENDQTGPVHAIHAKGGIIKTYPTLKEFKEDNVYKEWLRMGRLPKKGCRHCWERGWEGRDSKSGVVIVCRCTYKRI